MKRVDYSQKAIAMRIERLSQLRELCISLGKANPRTPQKERPAPGTPKKDRG